MYLSRSKMQQKMCQVLQLSGEVFHYVCRYYSASLTWEQWKEKECHNPWGAGVLEANPDPNPDWHQILDTKTWKGKRYHKEFNPNEKLLLGSKFGFSV